MSSQYCGVTIIDRGIFFEVDEDGIFFEVDEDDKIKIHGL